MRCHFIASPFELKTTAILPLLRSSKPWGGSSAAEEAGPRITSDGRDATSQRKHLNSYYLGEAGLLAIGEKEEETEKSS